MLETEINTRSAWCGDALRNQAESMHLAAILAQLRPKEDAIHAARAAAKLHQIGRALRHLGVAYYNVGLTSRQEKRREKLAEEASTIAGWYGLEADTYGDPCGYVLRLYGADLPRNDLGGGFGVL